MTSWLQKILQHVDSTKWRGVAFGLFKRCPVQSLDHLPILMFLRFCSIIQEECLKRRSGYVTKSHLSHSNISHLTIHNQPYVSFDYMRKINKAAHTELLNIRPTWTQICHHSVLTEVWKYHRAIYNLWSTYLKERYSKSSN
jgi:hypothetical protein